MLQASSQNQQYHHYKTWSRSSTWPYCIQRSSTSELCSGRHSCTKSQLGHSKFKEKSFCSEPTSHTTLGEFIRKLCKNWTFCFYQTNVSLGYVPVALFWIEKLQAWKTLAHQTLQWNTAPLNPSIVHANYCCTHLHGNPFQDQAARHIICTIESLSCKFYQWINAQ